MFRNAAPRVQCGWAIQNYKQLDLSAAHGIAVREVRLKERRCDYLLLIDRKPAQEKPWTTKLWIYDLRTNLHFTLNEWSSCDIG